VSKLGKNIGYKRSRMKKKIQEIWIAHIALNLLANQKKISSPITDTSNLKLKLAINTYSI
jgi:hypothetical protein